MMQTVRSAARAGQSRRLLAGSKAGFRPGVGLRAYSSGADLGYQKPEVSDEEFVKLLRKPPLLYKQIVEGVKHDLRNDAPTVKADAKFQSLLS
jgi:hypothetical protein